MSHLPPHHQQFRQQQQQQQLAAASGAAAGAMSPTSAAQLSASAAHFHNQLAASQLASHQLHQIPHHLLSGHNQFGANPHAHLFAPNHPLSHPLSLNLNLAQANGMMAAAGGMPTSAQNNTNTTTTSGSESTSASSTPNSNQHNGGGGGSNNTSFLIKDILRYDGQKRKQRKARTAFSDHQLKELEASFEAKKYLTVQDRVELAARLKLSDTQVKTWYQNRRTKHKRQTAVGLELLSEAGHLMAYQSVLESSGSWLMKHYANTTNTQINMAAALLAAQAQAQAQAQAAQLAHVASSGAAGHQLHHHHHQHQANMLAAAAAAAAAAQSASSQADDNNKQHLQHQHQNLQHQHQQQQNRDSPSPATSTPPASKNDSLSSSSSGNANASANARATLSSPSTPPSRAPQSNMSFAGSMNINNLISQTTASGTPPHQRQSPHTSR